MKTKLLVALLAGLLVIVLLTGAVLAMSSPSYRLDWFVNLSGAGGGPANSAGYAANFTIGQNAASAAASMNYHAGLGYWAAFPFKFSIYLPVIVKSP
jgi:hypothetical protein